MVEQRIDTTAGSHGLSYGPANADYSRVENLYEISKRLNQFEGVEATFPEILRHVREIFPIFSAVLIENRGQPPTTFVWPIEDLSDDQASNAVARARASFSYFMGSSLDQIAHLKTGHIEISSMETGTHFSEEISSDKFLVFPLVVDYTPVFGVLQFESSEILSEEDVKFANALANIVATALDRFHRVQDAHYRDQLFAHEMQTQRDESRHLVNKLEEEKGLRERFVQTLSHDLKTPLSTIKLCAQLMQRSKDLAPSDTDIVYKLWTNTRRLEQMIEQLLDANRIQAGEKLPLDIEVCDLSVLAKEVVKDFCKHSEAQILFDSPLEVKGHWDCDALQRVVENLVGNAVKYGQPQTPILVSLKKSTDFVTLSVHNHGSPISQSDQLTLFDQFRRTSSARKGGKQGWGLGLTLAKGVSEAHGGQIRVESTLEQGTTFFVQLPYDSRSFQD